MSLKIRELTIKAELVQGTQSSLSDEPGHPSVMAGNVQSKESTSKKSSYSSDFYNDQKSTKNER